MIGRFQFDLLLLFTSIFSQGYSFVSCVSGSYNPNGNNLTIDFLNPEGMHCSLKVEFISVEPCEIRSFELANDVYKWNFGHLMGLDLQNYLFGINFNYSKNSKTKTDSNNTSHNLLNVSVLNSTSSETTDNLTAEVTNSSENVSVSHSQTTEIPSTETTLLSNSTGHTTNSETKRWKMPRDPLRKEDPAIPVVFTCTSNLCNKNLSFTERQIDLFLDYPKYICIKKYFGEFEKTLAATFRNATKLKESNISSELFESDTVESTLPPTTEKYEPPPDKHVPEGIPLYAVFLGSLVISVALTTIRQCSTTKGRR